MLLTLAKVLPFVTGRDRHEAEAWRTGPGSHFSLRTLGRRQTWRASTSVLTGEFRTGPQGPEQGELEVDLARLGGGGREGLGPAEFARILQTRSQPLLRLRLRGEPPGEEVQVTLELRQISRELTGTLCWSELAPGLRRAFLQFEIAAGDWGLCLPARREGSHLAGAGDLSLVFDLRLVRAGRPPR